MTSPHGPRADVRRRALRALVQQRRQESAAPHALTPRPPGAEVPLTLTQEWLLTAGSAVTALGGLSTGGRLSVAHRLDHARLRAACARVAARADTFGYRVTESGGTLVQRLAPPSDRIAWCASTAQAAWSAPFDPARGPVLRGVVEEHEGGTRLTLSAARHALDRQSVGPLLAAVARAYDEGGPAPHGEAGGAYEGGAPPAVECGDFAYWHRRRFPPETLADLTRGAAARWGTPRPALLPYDRRPAAGPPTGAGACVRRAVDVPRGAGGPALLAAVGAALRRFGASAPLRVGVPDGARGDAATEGLLGPLTAASALALDVRGGVTARELRERAARAWEEAARDPLPLAAVAELDTSALGPESLLPVGVDVVTLPALALGGATAVPELLASPVAAHDLELILAEGPSGAELLAEYRPELFGPATVTALLDAVAALLADPAAPLGPPAAATAPPVPEQPPARAGEGARGSSVLTPDETVSAAASEARHSLVRQALRAAGATPGARVAVHAPAGAMSPATVLAALDAGCDVLVTGTGEPAPRREAWERHAGVEFTVSADGSVYRARETATALRRDPGGALLVGLRAYGRPRVLRVPLPVLRGAAETLARTLGLGPSDTYAPDAQWGGEHAVVAALAAARSGCALFLDDARGTPDERFDALLDAGVTVAELTDDQARELPVHLLGLRVHLGRLTPGTPSGDGTPADHSETADGTDGTGEAGEAEEAQEAQEADETAGTVLRRRAVPEAPDAALTSLARQAPHTGPRLAVLNEDLAPVPERGTGRLWALVAPGTRHLDDPAATAACFVPAPFGPPGGRMADCSAYARVGPGGTVEVLGFSPDRITAHGRTLLAADVAEAVTARTGLLSAAGSLGPGTGGAPGPGAGRPYAAVVRESGDGAVPGTAGLEALLPAWAVPTELLALAPGTDGAALASAARAAAARAALAASGPYEPPATDAERALAEGVLGPVLGLSRIGRDDNVFALGGTSLHLIRILALVRSRHGVDIPMAEIFTEPTLRSLAALLERGADEAESGLAEVEELLTAWEAPSEPGTTTDQSPADDQR